VLASRQKRILRSPPSLFSNSVHRQSDVKVRDFYFPERTYYVFQINCLIFVMQDKQKLPREKSLQSGTATIKDLAPEEKEKIGELMRRLAN